MTPIIISSLAIIIFSALIHASFQLSWSVLTLMSNHSLGKKKSHIKVVSLMNSFILGAFILTGLLISALTLYLTAIFNHSNSIEQLTAASICGLMIGLGVATWTLYYRKGESTALWLPRGFADYLSKRSKVTDNVFEAFALGMTSIIAELIFIIGPVLAGSLAILTMPNVYWQIAGVFIYTSVSIISLLVIIALVGGGHSVAELQKWRIKHKRFLQFVAGGSLVVLAGFIFVDRVLGVALYGGF